MIFFEAFKMALRSVRSHKLRSSLTLVGIIAGVASIIAVMTGISVVQASMEKEMSVLGSTTFQVQKWPAGGFNNDVEWRKIQRRKPITVANSAAVRDNVSSVDLVGSELWGYGATIKFRGESSEGNAMICGGTKEYAPNNTHYIEFGRNISDEDVKTKRKVVVIGYALAELLFPFIDPIGHDVKVDGRNYRVIGIFEQKSSAMGGNFDNYILMPVSTFTSAYGLRGDIRGGERSVNMTVNAKSPELVATAIEETRAVLRRDRGVPAREEDDFTIFTNDSQIRNFNEATAGVKGGAFVIGIVALLVAGIGITNIMLVSVTERTREIGVRKAVGAKRKHILLQFLLEAILLCNVGGVIGVLVGFALGNIVTFFTPFPANVPVNWAWIGVIFCTVVGITFGMWPALRASRLPPIAALSHE